jgi:ethanolamine utilization protein EutQ
MTQVIHFPRTEMNFAPYGAPGDDAGITRLVGPELSATMGVGVARFNECSIEWTVLYDEAIIVLEGEFHLRLQDRLVIGKPGDVIWVPANTPLRYEGKHAVVCYTLYPVDWRARHGIG